MFEMLANEQECWDEHLPSIFKTDFAQFCSDLFLIDIVIHMDKGGNCWTQNIHKGIKKSQLQLICIKTFIGNICSRPTY